MPIFTLPKLANFQSLRTLSNSTTKAVSREHRVGAPESESNASRSSGALRPQNHSEAAEDRNLTKKTQETSHLEFVDSRQRGNLLRRALKRALSGPTESSSERTPAQDRAIDFTKQAIRRYEQRLRKYKAMLERLEDGKWKTNAVKNELIRGTYRGSQREHSRPLHVRPFGASGFDKAAKQDKASNNKNLNDSSSNLSRPRRSDFSELGSDVSPGRAFGDVQTIALEKALGRTTVTRLSSKQRRQEYYDDVIKPRQSAQEKSPGSSFLAELAIAKSAAAKAKVLRLRNNDIRNVPSHPSYGSPASRRSYHSQPQVVLASSRNEPIEPVDSRPQSADKSAVFDQPEFPADDNLSTDVRKLFFDTDVLYQAFCSFFATPPYSDAWLVRTGYGKRLKRQGLRLKQLRTLEEKYAPAFDIWDKLAARLRQDIFCAVIGVRPDELARIGQITISQSKLARSVNVRVARHLQGRPSMRDDPLWEDIIDGRHTAHELIESGMNAEEASTWQVVRAKLSSCTQSAHSQRLGGTKHRLLALRRQAEHSRTVLIERSRAIHSRAARALGEWAVLSNRVQTELWCLAIGVRSDHQTLRSIAYKDIRPKVEDVAAALAWRSTQKRLGSSKEFVSSRAELLGMNQLLSSSRGISQDYLDRQQNRSVHSMVGGNKYTFHPKVQDSNDESAQPEWKLEQDCDGQSLDNPTEELDSAALQAGTTPTIERFLQASQQRSLATPVDPEKVRRLDSQLRRFNKGKRRYENLLARDRANKNPAPIYPALNPPEMWELPHETASIPYEIASKDSQHQPSQIFKRISSRLAPLRRTPDIDQSPLSETETGPQAPKLTHLSASGEAHMVSVAAKPDTRRTAIAVGKVLFSNDDTYNLVSTAALKKGDVLAISRIAGIQAAKMCPSIIPLCHPIMITSVNVDVTPFNREGESGIAIEGKVECTGPTGVEMEALTAVMGAALTVIDMVKAVDKAASIEGVKVVYKAGGKSGTWADPEWEPNRM